MALVRIITKTEQYIQVNGKMINNMVRALKLGQMDLSIRATTNSVKKMEKEGSIGMTAAGTKANLAKTT